MQTSLPNLGNKNDKSVEIKVADLHSKVVDKGDVSLDIKQLLQI